VSGSDRVCRKFCARLAGWRVHVSPFTTRWEEGTSRAGFVPAGWCRQAVEPNARPSSRAPGRTSRRRQPPAAGSAADGPRAISHVCAYPVASGQRKMSCRSVPRPSFPQTPIEWQRRFATAAVLCHRGGLRGVSGRVSPAGRLPRPAPRTAQGQVATGSPRRRRLADSASGPRAGTASRRRRGPRSIGLGPSRCVTGWRARPETFAAPGFSDLRTGFVLRDESARCRRSRAPHGSGRVTPEHDPGSPALGPRPPPLAILA
jgi:hypothetical protein